MLNRTIRAYINGLLACALPLFSIGCGGNESATPEQRKELTAAVETAAVHLKESGGYERLPDAQIPTAAESKPDYYATPEKELRFVGKGIVATITGDSAEVLFTLSVKKDSASRENRDALVRLVRDSGKWEGSGAYIVGGR